MGSLKRLSAGDPTRDSSKKKCAAVFVGFVAFNGLISFMFLEYKKVSFAQEHFSIYRGMWLLTYFLVNFLWYRRARNQFHVFTLFNSLSTFILCDAMPFMVSLTPNDTLGSILVQ